MPNEPKKPNKSRKNDRHGAHRMVRLPMDLYEAIQTLAEANNRPITWEIRLAIRNHLTDNKKGKQPPKDG